MKNAYNYLLTTLIIASTISCTKKSEDAVIVAVTEPSLSYTLSTGKYGTVGSIMSVVPYELTENGSSIVNCSIKDGTTALPTWASINATTCVISGTPTAGLNPTVYTLVATNSVGNSADATVTLAVSVDIVDPIGLVINAGETEAYIYDNLSGCLKIDLVNGTNSFLNSAYYIPLAFDNARNKIIINFGSLSEVDSSTGVTTVLLNTSGIEALNTTLTKGYILGNDPYLIEVNISNGTQSTVSGSTNGTGPSIPAGGWNKRIVLNQTETFAYIYDYSMSNTVPNNTIYEVNLSNGNRRLVANSFTVLRGLLISPDGNTGYAVDQYKVYSVNLSNGNTTLLSGDSAGTGPQMSSVWGLALNQSGTKIYAGTWNIDPLLAGIFVIDVSTGNRTLLAN